ncbi:acyl carrier protein [Nocardia terpenica]|uniref:Acyl carrier protein n=1 Tax=Nocardia terpenica TaxID=455432 RepID=A0A164PK05_9NOCA|nr:phosphopantetheine-binding protein [Nocardia terpenica]ATL66409.1 phosphopantetheine-binding-protein [Nocardia terpenica]KZM75673.1 phosphopantetheine-binding-protein [Nocardia terpenica]MBF6064828.1 acyl carrier protein [Nocardia terpenica]MBF6107343.1 acyl carrier protein [Nocardia terpenica]MBF6115100.1 acyl carrier protein [Nocardia terpenica]
MIEKIRESVITALREMNYDTSEVTGATILGPEGLDLESLAVAELAVRLQDEYGVRFQDEEMGELAGATLDQFAAIVSERISAAPAGADSV